MFLPILTGFTIEEDSIGLQSLLLKIWEFRLPFASSNPLKRRKLPHNVSVYYIIKKFLSQAIFEKNFKKIQKVLRYKKRREQTPPLQLYYT